MRAMRLSLAGMVTLSLFASLPPAVVAAQEDEQGPTIATYVTGIAIPDPESGSYVSEPEGASYSELEMDWSDPRLPSRMLVRCNVEGAQGVHPDGSGVTVRIAWAVRLEGPEGSWSGTGHELAWTLVPESGGTPQDAWTQLLVLVGEGEHEGLSATLTGTGDRATPAFEGFIFEDALTMPDPIEPTSE